MRRSGRRLVAALATLGSIAAFPAAAEAHPPGQQVPDAAYYRAEIISVSPVLSGVTARVDPGGEWLELSNTGSDPVVVLGYAAEPYLRVGGGRAEENQLSQTTYLNRALFADPVPTSQGGAGTIPSWHLLGLTDTVRWHDHRIHWMGQSRPPVVAADPARPHLVGTWAVHAIAGTTPFDIRGALTWTGKPAATGISSLQAWLLTILVGLAVAVGILTIALVRSRRRPPSVSAAAVPVGEPLPATDEPSFGRVGRRP
jgi:hypothetical protein